IRQQRIIGAKKLPDIRGMKDRGIEIGVVANRRGQKHLDISLRDQMTLGGLAVGGGRVLTQDCVETSAQSAPRTVPERHQWIECVECARIGRSLRDLVCKQVLALHPGEVKHAVSDRDSYSRPGDCGAATKDAEGQILNGKIGAHNVGGFNPTLMVRIVGLVEDGFHKRCRDLKSSTGSVNEHDPNEIAKSRRARNNSRALRRCSRHQTPSSSKRKAVPSVSLSTSNARASSIPARRKAAPRKRFRKPCMVADALSGSWVSR